MYNDIQYNEAPYGGATPITTKSSGDDFQFDGYGLQNENITISKTSHSAPPTKDISTSRVPRGNGRNILGNFDDIKVIKFSGSVRADSAAEFETLLTTIKRRVSAQNKILQITELDGTVKRWVANLQKPEKLFAKREAFHVTFMPFSIEFLCVAPYGHDEDYSASALEGVSAPTVNQTLTNTGDADADPVFYLTVLAATAVTQIDLQNVTTGEQMRVSPASLVAGDVIIFDSENKTVTQNGSPLDYQGSFLKLSPDDNNIQFDITGTSHSLDITYKHKNAYL